MSLIPGVKNIKEEPLAQSEKIFPPPIHIKLGLMKNLVKAMNKDGGGFQYLKTKFPRISDAKMKEGIFVGPQIRELMKDSNFESTLNEAEQRAWTFCRTDVVSYSTRYRRTYQSLVAVLWALGARALPARAARARESHSVSFCFRECACPAQHALIKKINSQTKHRLGSRTAIKDLVDRISKVIFESQEHVDAEVARDALLAYMCHDTSLPCSQESSGDGRRQEKLDRNIMYKYRKFRSVIQNHHKVMLRSLLEADIDNQNIEFDYSNNQLDFDNEIGRKARDIIGKYDTKAKAPLDFDAQMEREKLLYYQQRYMDNAENYDDVVIVKKHLDADFNFPNDQRMDQDFEEESYREVTTEVTEEICVKKDHIVSLFAYRDWSHKRDMGNFDNRRRGTLIAYGLIHNIVQNIIRMISENKPKLVIYSGHDKTLQALILALGVTDYKLDNIHYASRMILEIYRKKELRDEFKFVIRKAVAQDFYFRIVFNGQDITNQLTFCKPHRNVAMKVADVLDDTKVTNSYLCPIENIVRFIHDDYFSIFNASNFKDACSFYTNDKRLF
ncbi:2-phosphoxylose phosphatase 1 [Eumeta japonica]|uniref:2-phosphoxylose phosphatase 1 n=1 Tax=Eumeta variegata TaxID=151549 RepID=A0A4C1TAX4_EUMVA|nr:2-phosphoxylose phosphatase 1 [Eumeta japonica]